MKTAIVSVTSHGAYLGYKVASALREASETKATEVIQCFEKDGKGCNQNVGTIYFDKMSTIMEMLFKEYDRVLCIMATGIVVRMIAPYIVHKSKDPAIVVMDEQGKYSISLLSGHLGGANEWALEISEIIGAIPVITTATDVNQLPAPDVFARKHHLTIQNFDALRVVNAAIVAKEEVYYYIDSTLAWADVLCEQAKVHGVQVVLFTPEKIEIPAETSLLEENTQRNFHLPTMIFTAKVLETTQPKVIITDKVLKKAEVYQNNLFMYVKTMVVGVGCRRDTEASLIFDAVMESLHKAGRAKASVLAATSVDVKANEKGLLEAMKLLEWPIQFYEAEILQHFVNAHHIKESNFVKNTIGVGNVCETTSLILAQSQQLIQQKTLFPRITVAIAQVGFKLSVLDRVMKNL